GRAVSAPESVTGAPAVWLQAKVTGPPLGSTLPLPSRVTVAPDATAWSAPAFATGAGFTGRAGLTVTFTVDGAEAPLALLTTSEKVSAAGCCPDRTAGAVKPGLIAVALERDTAGPRVWVHLKLRASPVGSALTLPSSATTAPDATAWSGPASAVGALLNGGVPVGALPPQAASAAIRTQAILCIFTVAP